MKGEQGMDKDLKKLQASIRLNQTLSFIIIILLLVVILGGVRSLAVLNGYKESLEDAAAIAKELRKVDLPRLSEDLHTTTEAINAVDWNQLSSQLNDLDLQGIKETIDNLDLEEINETLGNLDVGELVEKLEGLDVDKINQTMDEVSAALEKLNKFGLF